MYALGNRVDFECPCGFIARNIHTAVIGIRCHDEANQSYNGYQDGCGRYWYRNPRHSRQWQSMVPDWAKERE